MSSVCVPSTLGALQPLNSIGARPTQTAMLTRSSHQGKPDLTIIRAATDRHYLIRQQQPSLLMHSRQPHHKLLPAQPRTSSRKHQIQTYPSLLREAGPRTWRMASHQVQVEHLSHCIHCLGKLYQPHVKSTQPQQLCRKDRRSPNPNILRVFSFRCAQS